MSDSQKIKELEEKIAALDVLIETSSEDSEFENPPVGGPHGQTFTPWCTPPVGSSGLTYDYVYVGQNPLEVPTKTTNFLKVYLDGVTLPEWVPAMPESQDEDSEVFDVTKNQIHLPGNFGG